MRERLPLKLVGSALLYLGPLAVALILLYRTSHHVTSTSPLVVEVISDIGSPVYAGSQASIDFRIRNKSPVDVALVVSSRSCACIAVTGVEKVVPGGGTVDGKLLIDTTGLYGVKKITVEWTGSDATHPIAKLDTQLYVLANEAVRHARIGEVPRGKQFTRRVNLTGLNGLLLSDNIVTLDPSWVVCKERPQSANETVLRIEGFVPVSSASDASSEQIQTEATLRFNESRMQVAVKLLITADVAPDWIIPQEVVLRRTASDEGQASTSFLVTERSWGTSLTRGGECLTQLTCTDSAVSTQWKTVLDRSIELTLTYNPMELAHAQNDLRFMLRHDNGEMQNVKIPLRVVAASSVVK